MAAGRLLQSTTNAVKSLRPLICSYHLPYIGRNRMSPPSVPLTQVAKTLPHMPRLPVPPLKATLEKYLRTVRPLVSDEEYCCTENLVNAFAASGGIGEKLQTLLVQKAEKTESWLADWWLSTAYLTYRSPVVVYSSPGLVMPQQSTKTVDDQIRCAAKVILGALDYKNLVDNNLLSQEMMGKNPLDMSQHGMIFGTCRIPGLECDELSFAPRGLDCPKHIIVMHDNNFYKVNVCDETGIPYAEADLVHMLSSIVQNRSNRSLPIGILTSENRNTWGKVYKEMRKSEKNKETLVTIQKSLFVVCLDGPNNSSAYNSQTVAALQTVHGCGAAVNSGNRWFDKTVQFIIGANGEFGICYEHSPAEGPPIANIGDHVMDFLCGVKTADRFSLNDANKSLVPEILEFKVTADLHTAVENAERNLALLIQDVDMSCFTFKQYGKNFIKSQQLSPDSYIQVAMQLAFYRIHKDLGATYETASTRQFLHGRTETIRSATTEALEFCKTILSSKFSLDEKKLALQRAVTAHKNYVNEAVRGFGVDRHLLGLRLIAVENDMKIPELYLDHGFVRSSHFRISSSQVAARYGSFMCFGPLVPDGYGCCYNPRMSDIIFGISAFNSCAETSAANYHQHLHDSLVDMHNLLCLTQTSKL